MKDTLAKEASHSKRMSFGFGFGVDPRAQLYARQPGAAAWEAEEQQQNQQQQQQQYGRGSIRAHEGGDLYEPSPKRAKTGEVRALTIGPSGFGDPNMGAFGTTMSPLDSGLSSVQTEMRRTLSEASAFNPMVPIPSDIYASPSTSVGGAALSNEAVTMQLMVRPVINGDADFAMKLVSPGDFGFIAIDDLDRIEETRSQEMHPGVYTFCSLQQLMKLYDNINTYATRYPALAGFSIDPQNPTERTRVDREGRPVVRDPNDRRTYMRSIFDKWKFVGVVRAFIPNKGELTTVSLTFTGVIKALHYGALDLEKMMTIGFDEVTDFTDVPLPVGISSWKMAYGMLTGEIVYQIRSEIVTFLRQVMANQIPGINTPALLNNALFQLISLNLPTASAAPVIAPVIPGMLGDSGAYPLASAEVTSQIVADQQERDVTTFGPFEFSFDQWGTTGVDPAAPVLPNPFGPLVPADNHPMFNQPAAATVQQMALRIIGRLASFKTDQILRLMKVGMRSVPLGFNAGNGPLDPIFRHRERCANAMLRGRVTLRPFPNDEDIRMYKDSVDEKNLGPLTVTGYHGVDGVERDLRELFLDGPDRSDSLSVVPGGEVRRSSILYGRRIVVGHVTDVTPTGRVPGVVGATVSTKRPELSAGLMPYSSTITIHIRPDSSFVRSSIFRDKYGVTNSLGPRNRTGFGTLRSGLRGVV